MLDGRMRLLSILPSVFLLAAPGARAQDEPRFEAQEATILQIHSAMREGRLTCRGLVETYMRRIETYDKNGPAINAIVMTNPEALKLADDLDRRFKSSGLVGPLHCIPMIVKDNFETIGLQSANGSLSLKGFVSNKDAFQVKRVKEAGALVLAKSNMAEWAFTPYETVSSILPGYTRNPYSLDRVTAGSSGGTAAAIAASLGAVGLGSDTGNSIQGPSSHQALVGIRSTMGLTSRAGVIPLSFLADIAGPMARTVEDAVAVFQVIVGEDPADPSTAGASSHLPQNYQAALIADGLAGSRIGVLRQAYERETTDPEIVRIFMQAVDDLRRAGATIVDPATVPGLDQIRRPEGMGRCRGFKYDLNEYLAAQGDLVPMKSLTDIVKSGLFHPSVRRQLERSEEGSANGPDSPECRADAVYRDQLRAAVSQLMDAQKLDALVYPTWSNPPRLIGDLNTPHGDNSQLFSPVTGFPAIQVPMGYSLGGRLPAGMTFFGRAWSELLLIRLAYSYEQATRHRRPPETTPPLR
jgi:Asp-tRNA(Asn)/Glu-tRNA(Gln) amidotransferase A subunit family amidase